MKMDRIFTEIYEATRRKVLAYITAKCGNTADISDIFQDTYMELYAILRRRGTGYVRNPEAMVMRLARQMLFRHYRWTDRYRQWFAAKPVTEEGEEAELPDMETLSTEDIAADNLTLEEIRRFLDGRGEEIKKIFHLYFTLGLTVPEIAALMELGESNVKNKLYRTLKELREIFR